MGLKMEKKETQKSGKCEEKKKVKRKSGKEKKTVTIQDVPALRAL